MSIESSPGQLRGRLDRLKSIHLEVAILQDLSHHNIIRVHELIELQKQIVLVMPYASSCTLLQYIQEQRKGAGVWCFPEKMAWSIFQQLVSGVGYLHNNLTVHHNLTLETILFDCKQYRVIITGFSIAEIVRPDIGEPIENYLIRNRYFRQRRVINPYFTAPEILQSSKDSNSPSCTTIGIEGKADVYSCGVILVSLNQRTSLFQVAKNLRVHNDERRRTV
jgi:protein-serine/threonine kinase